MSDDPDFLNDVRKRVSDREALHPEDYSRLVTLFNPSKPPQTRSRAFITLSSICAQKRSGRRDEEQHSLATENIRRAFLPAIERMIADVAEQSLMDALTFIVALFAVDSDAASSIFAHEGFQDSMIDSLDLFPSSSTMQMTVAKILSSAAGHKECGAIMSLRCFTWLEMTYRLSTSSSIKAIAALALIKLSQRTTDSITLDGQVQDERFHRTIDENELFLCLKDAIKSFDGSLASIADALEGLVYLSAKSVYKEDIADDLVLLKGLVSLQSSLQRDSTEYGELGTVPYGLALIVVHLTTYKARLTEEQAQAERLRRMIKPSFDSATANGTLEGTFDSDEHVRSRGRKLMATGIAQLLVSLSRVSESATTRIAVGKALLGLIEDKDNRGPILQAGGAKALMAIIRSLQQSSTREMESPEKPNINFADLGPLQALAKLAITASPMQVFGPNENVSIEAIRPLACLILHPSSSLLQKFEGMMALTNLSSVSTELAERIAKVEGLFSRVECMLLEDHTLIRRAATELVCNLVSSSEFAYDKFIGRLSPDSSTNIGQAKSRIQILSALCDVDDRPTRLAASGALAVLSESPAVCNLLHLLELEHHRIFIILKQLIDPSDDEVPDGGLLHRGIVCIRNIFLHAMDEDMKLKLKNESVDYGLTVSLLKVAQWIKEDKIPRGAIRPTAEAVEWLAGCGQQARVL